MRLAIKSYRWGHEYLDGEPAWTELLDTLGSIQRDDVVVSQQAQLDRWLRGQIQHAPVGGQGPTNSLTEKLLGPKGWRGQQRAVPATKTSPKWTIDFMKDQIGVEVAFNNAGAIPQNLLRLGARGSSTEIPAAKQIRVGVIVLAMESLKTWSSMDKSVQTYERLCNVWLKHMQFALPLPLCIVGLDAADDASGPGSHLEPSPPDDPSFQVSGDVAQRVPWPATQVFPGRKLKLSGLTPAELAVWQQRQAAAPAAV